MTALLNSLLNATLALSALALALIAEPVASKPIEPRRTGNDCVVGFMVPEPTRTYPPTLQLAPMFARCSDTAPGMAWRSI